jgi:hypothetical protein
VAGQLSDRARTNAQALGLIVESHARETLLPKEEWEAPELLEVDDDTPDPPAEASPALETPSPAEPLPAGPQPGTGPEWQDAPSSGGVI